MTRRYVRAAALHELFTQLTPVDLAITHSVSELRFISGSQLTRLHGDSKLSTASRARAMRRALSRLVTLDCLVCLPRRVGGARFGSAATVYRLGLAGQRLAIERGWLAAARTRRAVVPGSLFLAHALAVAELHCLLVEADRGGRLELVERSAEPACWRQMSGIGSFAAAQLKPDSFARFVVGADEWSYFIEVDRSTEGSRTIARKLDSYVTYHRQGSEQAEHGVFPKVQWLTADAERVAVIEAEIARLPLQARKLFGVCEFDNALHTFIGDANPNPHTI